MAAIRTSAPVRDDRTELSAVFIIAAVLWFATGAASGLRSGTDEWESAYALFSVLLLIAAVTSIGAITMYTARPKPRSVARMAAGALAILAVVSTIIAWAFVVWAVLLAAACAALARTGSPQRREVGWLSLALLVGLAVALVGVWAELGPPGEYHDHSEAQGWGVTVACGLAAAVLCALARRAHRTSVATGTSRPT